LLDDPAIAVVGPARSREPHSYFERGPGPFAALQGPSTSGEPLFQPAVPPGVMDPPGNYRMCPGPGAMELPQQDTLCPGPAAMELPQQETLCCGPGAMEGFFPRSMEPPPSAVGFSGLRVEGHGLCPGPLVEYGTHAFPETALPPQLLPQQPPQHPPQLPPQLPVQLLPQLPSGDQVGPSKEYQAAYREMYQGLLRARLEAAAPDHYED